MRDKSFYERLEASFPADPDASLLEDEHGEVHRYRDAVGVSARYARLLRESDLGKGDRLLAQLEKSPEALYLYLACLRTGIVFVPLNTAYKERETRFFIEDAEPSAVVCTPDNLDRLEPLARAHGARRIFTLNARGDGTLPDASRDLGDAFDNEPAGEDEIAAILYTSGTTGRPKGAMITHRNLYTNAETLRALWEFRSEDVLLHALPVFHAHGLFTALHCVLLAGARMLFLPRFEPRAVCTALPRATVMMGVPTFYTRLLREPDLSAKTCANMRLFISGSAPLLPETFERFRERTGHRILERYGTTESMITTSNPLDGERRPGSVGLPLDGVEVRITGPDGCLLAAGEPGRLECRGPNVFAGYWRRPEATDAAFTPDGFFVTGDIARADDDGYIALVGRQSDMIISGGYNVYPREVENVLDRIEGVEQSAVFGVPHPDFGEGVVAALESEGVTEEGVIAYAKAHLAGYKVPKRVLVLPELPRTPMGKIRKNLLRERYAALFRESA